MVVHGEVVVIDDDLGVSPSSVERPGFDRFLAAICRGVLAAVVSVEAFRLARYGRDWILFDNQRLSITIR